MNVTCRNLFLSAFSSVLILTSCGGGAKESSDLVKLQGAGASFPAPLYSKWFKSYGGSTREQVGRLYGELALQVVPGVPRQLKTGAGATPAKRIPSSGMLTTRDPEHAASVRAAATMWSKFWSATRHRTCLGGGRTPDLV